jgi:hypothetical protein
MINPDKMFRSIFNILNIVFWVLLLSILLMNFPLYKGFVFNGDDAKKIFAEKKDSITTIPIDTLKNEEKKDSITTLPIDTLKNEEKIDTVQENKIDFVWEWVDYKSKKHKLKFQLAESDLKKISRIRDNLITVIVSDKTKATKLYADLAKRSMPYLDVLIQKIKVDLKNKEITGYQEVMDYVISSIQFIPYTLVLNEKKCPCEISKRYYKDICEPLSRGDGCCNSIEPYGVFAPAEFLIKKTGDCDTKALFAFVILNSLGYDVAVLVGSVGDGYHAMLGVATPKTVVRTRYVTHQGKIYYPWEVTSGNSRLGDMRMWTIWNDWEVYLN